MQFVLFIHDSEVKVCGVGRHELHENAKSQYRMAGRR